MSRDKLNMNVYAIRTTSGQERTVADLMASKVALKKIPVASILAAEVVKGYIFAEASGAHYIDEAMSGVRHARTRTKGKVGFEVIERFIVTKPIIEDVGLGDTVEVAGGPFRGLKAKIIDVDKSKEEVTIEFFEEGFAILPVTVHSDYVKILRKAKGESVGREESD